MKTHKLIAGLFLAGMVAIGAAEFNKGIDLTGKTAITVSQLHQLVDSAYPATDRGMIIVTNNFPNVGAHSYYTNYLWYDISVSPPQLKSYHTGSWVSATIPAGSVGTAQLADYAVSAVKLGTNSVNTYAISNNAVTSDKLGSASVIEDKIYNGAVTSNKLASSSIYTANIVDRQVTGAKIGLSTITSSNIASGAIINDAIFDGAVDSAAITNGSIKLEDMAVDGGTAYQRVRMNAGATGWEWFTQPVPGLGITDISPSTYNTSGGTVIANNSELPDIADGVSIGNVTLTVAKSNSKVKISFNTSARYETGTGNPVIFAVFRGDTDVCIYSFAHDNYGATTYELPGLHFDFYVTPYSTGSITYKLRALSVTGKTSTFTLGEAASGDDWGGTGISQFVAQEIFTEAP